MKDQDRTKAELVSELTEQRHLNAELRQSNKNLEHILAHLVENLTEDIIITDFKGQINYVNKATEQYSGYSRQELIGEFRWILNGSQDAQKMHQEIVATMQRSQWWCRELPQRRKDGYIYLAELEIFPVLDDKGTPLAWASVQRDITECKKIEQQLRKSEARLRRITDNMLDIVCQTNIEGIIEYVSPSHKTILGHEPEDMVGRSVFAFIHPDDKARVKAALQAAIESRSPGKIEYRYSHANGDYLWLESAGNLLYDDNYRIVGAIFSTRDISERKHVERTLQLSEERFYKAFSSSPNPMAISTLDGCYVEINNSFTQVVGYRPDEVLGRTSRDLNIFDNIIRVEAMQKLQDQGTLRNYEAYIRTKSGDMRYGVFSADIIDIGDEQYLLTIFNDITERKQAEEELYRREQFLSSVFESIQDRLSVIDTEFNIVRTNKIVEQWYAQEQPLVGKKCYRAYHGNDEICAGCPSLQTINTGKPAHAIVTVKDAGGKNSICLDHYCHPFIDMTSRKLAGVIIYARDITEKLRLDQELARMESLHLIGQIAAGIGHEIRNPMTTVRGFLQLLGEKEECAMYKDYYDLMIAELDRANAIITEFLSLAKNKAVDLKRQSLNGIIEAIYPLIVADAMVHDKYVILELKNIPDLLLDEKGIRQLILNLTRNGLEAMAPGGHLTIRTYQEGQEVILAVQDQGCGIEPGLLAKLGTPFLTTKDNGTGLGLPVCNTIAVRHNATINIDPGPEGTTFLVRFKF